MLVIDSNIKVKDHIRLTDKSPYTYITNTFGNKSSLSKDGSNPLTLFMMEIWTGLGSLTWINLIPLKE